MLAYLPTVNCGSLKFPRMKPFLWHNIAEQGTVVIPLRAECLPRILWSEIEECFPQVLPPEVRAIDPLLEPELITDTPFVIETTKEGRLTCKFQAKDPCTGDWLSHHINLAQLLAQFRFEDYYSEDQEITAYKPPILTCLCGCAGCAGLHQQAFHIASRVVHWSIREYDTDFELFFERDAYERGALRMVHTLLQLDPQAVCHPSCTRYDSNPAALVNDLEALLVHWPDLRDLWEEIVHASSKIERC